MSYRRTNDDPFEDIKLYIFLTFATVFMLLILFSPNKTISNTSTNIPAETPQNTAGSYISVDTPAGSTTPKQFTRATSTGNVTTFL